MVLAAKIKKEFKKGMIMKKLIMLLFFAANMLAMEESDKNVMTMLMRSESIDHPRSDWKKRIVSDTNGFEETVVDKQTDTNFKIVKGLRTVDIFFRKERKNLSIDTFKTWCKQIEAMVDQR